MTTSKDITKDIISAYFNLDATLQPLNIAPTATGGAGIDNTDIYPPMQQSIPFWRTRGTEYVEKYLQKDREEQMARHNEIIGGSTVNVNTLEDIDDRSTAVGEATGIEDLDSEATQQIYSTYFNATEQTYDPELTITRYREEILNLLNINSVIIVQGPTGCGKTTQVPQYILDYHKSKGRYCNIIVTQPRKLAAISIARRVCQERKWQLGTIAGYQVAMDSKTSSDTRLSYVTTGVLLEKLVNAKRMDMYSHIIIDEVHERNQEIDFALLLTKKFLKTNSHRVKVILMSATFDSTTFASYYKLSPRMSPVPVVEITGKSKEVTEHYLHELKTLLTKIPDFTMSQPSIDPCLYDAVLKLMCVFDRIEKAEQNVPAEKDYAPSRGAVLIFLPGYEEIGTLADKLLTASFNKNFWIIPLHSTITVEEQAKVFMKAPTDQRKVILSTNIAESSITVPDVKYVIDFCLTKNLVTDSFTNYTSLQLEWASKANCIQRKGRAGRVDIGKVYRMVPRQFYDDLPEYGIPEIKRCPLTRTILQVKKLNICEPQEMLAFALDPPDLSDIGSAVLQLKEGLALMAQGSSPFDGELTFVGRVMANLPLDIKLSKLIMFGYAFQCLDECIIIAASLSLQSFFARPFNKALDAYRSRLAWADGTFSDCLCYLNAYQEWKQRSMQGFFRRPGGQTEKSWAEKSFIQLRRIKEVDLLVKEIKGRLEKFKIFSAYRQKRFADVENTLILKMVIAGAFFPNYFIQETLDEQEVNKEINENDPHSTVVLTGLPPKHGILYASALKDMFCSFSQNIVIEFEESKAYIRFPRNNDTTTSTILQAVYLALKMRKLRMPFEISVFSPEEADRKLKQYRAFKQPVNDNRLISNRMTVKYVEPTDMKKTELPALQTTLIKIFICYVNNCGHFWARYLSGQNIANFQFLENTINADQGKNLKPLTKPPQTNMLYLAPFAEPNTAVAYYRARIQEIRGQRARVFFVDYGNACVVDLKELREISDKTPDILNAPAMAFECYLAEIKPSSFKSPNGMWCQQAINWFKKVVNGQEVHARIYSVIQDTVRLELLRTRDGMIQSINKELCQMGYAEHAEESLVSKQNNELRKDIAYAYKTDAAVYDNIPKDVEVSWQEVEEWNRMQKTGRKIRLHGPFNPLEVSYSGMSFIDRCKCVKIERDSVNSVSLNPDPQESYATMLVAASVSVGQNSQELIARNTTLIPKMRGLPELICLLFSPYVEMRTDKKRESYIGALCGLGFDPETGEPFYPDHDIEIALDTNLQLFDISQINVIRMGFNLLLHSESGSLQYNQSSVAVVQEKTRKTILNLLQKKHDAKKPEFFSKCYVWNQISPNLLLDAEVNHTADCPHVLPLIKPASLVAYVDDLDRHVKDDLDKHIKELYSMVDNPNKDFKVIECKLCSEKLTSTRNLLVHLNSDKHLEKEEARNKRKRQTSTAK